MAKTTTPIALTTPLNWGVTLGAQFMASTDAATLRTADAARAHTALLALVAAHAHAWIDRVALIVEANVGGLNGTLGRPVVTVSRDRVAGIQLRAPSMTAGDAWLSITLECAPRDPRPGVRVEGTWHGNRYLEHYAFVDGGEHGLQVRVSGEGFSAEEAARVLVERWLAAVDMRDAARERSAERLTLDPLTATSPAPLAGLRIATWDPAAVDAICELDAAAFDQPWTPGMYHTVARAGAVYTARTSALVVAGVLASRVHDGECQIVRLAVHPSARRQGVGSHLLARAIADALTHGAVRAAVDINRACAGVRLFYERAGFSGQNSINNKGESHV